MSRMVLKRKVYTKMLEWKEKYVPESIIRLTCDLVPAFHIHSKAPLNKPFSGACLS